MSLNLLYDRKSYAKINPGLFNAIVYPLVRTVTKNALGENVETFVKGTGLRAFVDVYQKSEEKAFEGDTIQVHRVFVYILAYFNPELTNTNNRVEWEGKELHITDQYKAYEKNKYVRVKCMYNG